MTYTYNTKNKPNKRIKFEKNGTNLQEILEHTQKSNRAKICTKSEFGNKFKKQTSNKGILEQIQKSDKAEVCTDSEFGKNQFKT